MSQKNQFKDTLNLPNTRFPMRANLAENEPKTIKGWKEKQLYHTLVNSSNGNPPFRFHDGPPYANGNIHIGHLLNKVLKDIVLRSQNKLGKHCEFRPGWDCHGLPIEHRVLTEMSPEKMAKLDTLSEDIRRIAVRNECKKYAEKFIKIQSEQMQRLLTIGDYDTPYLTMTPDYEEKVLGIFADLVKEKLVYRQLKPVHWSIANQTALAEAELEYEDKTDTSIFVTVKVTDPNAIATLFNTTLPETPKLLLWTTTPWTLPANLAVAVHQNYDYSLVKFDNNTICIAAKERLDAIKDTCHQHQYDVLGQVKGAQLLGLEYQHPFCERTGTIIHGDFVTLEDGSGLVHIAPGHGTDDYIVGQAHQLDVYCPVRADGTYDDTVPLWLKGKSIWDANDDIISKLQDLNALFYQYEFVHSYPHDWRSKTPVIFRSTEQWFIGVDTPLASTQNTIRNMALSSTENDVQFIPEWGQKRLHGMLESRPDWCISRQRSWGLPIPAFRNRDGQILLTEQSVRAIAIVFGKEGSDAWFKLTPEELLQHYNIQEDPDAPPTIEINSLEKLYDIFDVWFESGSSWDAVMGMKNTTEQIDLYLEGSDQHRGWFHLSLLLGLGSQQRPPFKRILTHGFIVDKNGRKMSKSVGNTIDVDTLLKKYGAEVARWWVSSLAFENDIKVDLSFFDVASDTYRKIRNTIRFVISNLDDFPIDGPLTEQEIQKFCNTCPETSPEAYILKQTQDLIQAGIHAYETFNYRELNQHLYTFCNNDLSSFYCMVLKDRLYCDKQDSPRRRRAQVCLHIIASTLCDLLAPILPHTSQELFQTLYPNHDSIHTHTRPFSIVNISASPNWEHVLTTRQQVLKALEDAKESGLDNTLDAGIQVSDPNAILAPFHDDLADIFGVSDVQLVLEENILSIEDRREQPRCERSWKRDRTVKKRENGVFLSDRDAEAIGL